MAHPYHIEVPVEPATGSAHVDGGYDGFVPLPLFRLERRALNWLARGTPIRRGGTTTVAPPAAGRIIAEPVRALAYARNAAARARYAVLAESELKATRTSETVYVFGSGSSLNEISPPEWASIAAGNTISLREFPRQRFVRADYHMTGEVTNVEEYAETIRRNPLYANTIYIVQRGWFAYNGNNLIGLGLLPQGSLVFRYERQSRGTFSPYSRSLEYGLVHGYNSIISATNLAYLMGWRRIVLTGVDLYDKRYFWLPNDVTRHDEKPGVTYDRRFTGSDVIVDMLRRWAIDMEKEGVELSVYNPRSLLAQVLPVFSSAPSLT